MRYFNGEVSVIYCIQDSYHIVTCLYLLSWLQDAVLDLKGVELPVKMMLSGGRDGIVKLWR